MYCKIMVLVATCFAANILCITQHTVEEGKPVTLKCTDSVSKTSNTIFDWYKERLANQLKDNRIAWYDNSDGAQNSEGDLANRATIDGTTGALNIPSTKVSDDHFYSCWFRNTATGDIKNETQLTITVTPSQQDLTITTSPTGPVEEGETVSFNCSALRVKPPPRRMFWQFTDDASQHNGTYRNERNADSLTSSVSVNYTMVVNRKDNGRKVVCHYVTETGKDIQSEEATVTVLYTPAVQAQLIQGDKNAVKQTTVSLTCDSEQIDGIITWYKWQFANGTDLGNTTEKTWTYTARGNEETLQIVCIAGNAAGQSKASEPIAIEIWKSGQPVNSVIVVLGTLLALSVAKDFALVAYYCLRRNSTYGRAIILKNTVPIQRDGARCVTRDQGLAIVDAPEYEEVEDGPGMKGLNFKMKQNVKGARCVTKDQGFAMVDAAAYEEVGTSRDHVVRNNLNNDDDVQYENMGGEAPTYLELH